MEEATSTANNNTPTAAGVDATSSSTSVKLLIKASSQQYEDQIVESDLLWTVFRLKTQLSQIYPSKPPVADQKLIYSGQLLSDALQLKDVLRSYKDVYTHNHIFHLVYTPKHTLNQPTSLNPKSTKAATSNTSPSMSSNITATTSTDGLRQRHVNNAAAGQQQQTTEQQQQQYPQFAGLNYSQFMPQMMATAGLQCPPHNDPNNPQAAMPFSFPGQFNMQAMATQQAAMYNWMQQVYSQYMDQCLRFNNAAAAASQTGATNHPTAGMGFPPNPFLQQQMPYMPANANFNPVISHPTVAAATAASSSIPVASAATGAAPPVQPPAEAQAPAAPAAPRFPNIVQEEQENRDWLDSFFSITRLALFLTVLYFNSSPLRCLIVVFIAGGIYLYHIGVLRFRTNERNNNNLNRNNNAAQQDQIRQGVEHVQQVLAMQQQNPENAEAAEGREDGAEVPANENGADTAAPATDAAGATTDNDGNDGSSMISFVRTFVISFFTSLLPENPGAL